MSRPRSKFHKAECKNKSKGKYHSAKLRILKNRTQMKYKDCVTNEFNWLFIDFERLSLVSESLGFKCELVKEGEHFDYLARLEVL